MPYSFPHHLPHHLHIPNFFSKPLNALYISLTLRTFAVSLVSIFVVLFILEVTGNFLWVVAYFLAFSLLVVVFSVPIGWVVSRLGFRWSVFLASILLAIQFYLFIKAQQNPNLFFVIPFFEAAKLLLFWLPYHMIFVEDGSSDHYGREISLAAVLGQLTSVIAPVLGGFIIVTSGFSALFSLGVVVVLFSSLPLFFMSHHRREAPPDWRKVFRNMLTRNYAPIFGAFFGARSVAIVGGLIWPVFLFDIVGGSYSNIGILTSAVLLFSTATTFLTGVAVDRFGKRRTLKLGSWVNGLVWLFKALTQTPLQVLIVDSFHKLLGGLHGIPFDALTYVRAKRRESLMEFMVQREIAIHFGGFLTSLLIGLLWWLGVPIPAMFTIAALGYILSTLMISAK